MERKTCTKCGVVEKPGNSFHDYAHVIPRWFCKDQRHYEGCLLILCRSCHQKLEREMIHFIFRWVAKE